MFLRFPNLVCFSLAVLAMALPSIAKEADLAAGASPAAATENKAVDARPDFVEDETKTESFATRDPKIEEYRENVEFQQNLNTTIPLDLIFRNERNEEVLLRSFFEQGKPVMLNLVYFRCPGLCNAALGGMVEMLETIKYTAGDEYELLTISFDPRDTNILGAQKKAAYLQTFKEADMQQLDAMSKGWHFLTGTKGGIDALCEAVGFPYKYVEETGEYSHDSGLLFLTETGLISRYILGTNYPTEDAERCIRDASNGTVGSAVERAVDGICFKWDPKTGKYGQIINLSLIIGCFMMIGALFLLLFFLIRFDLKNNDPLGKNSSVEVQPTA